MSTREIASPIQGGAIDAAYNLSNTLLAVQQAGQILVLARQRPQIEFSPLASLPLEESDKEITCLAWAPPDQGAVLAAGTADGAILLWTGRAAPGSAACAPPASWSQPQRLPAGRRRVNQLAFEPSPVSAGVRALAAACEDGFVRLYESDARHEATRSWQHAGTLRIASKNGAPSALSWRDAGCDDLTSAQLPPMLSVGMRRGAAQVWWRAGNGEWKRGPALHDEDAEPISSTAVACLAWAPPMGRKRETIAVARGATVTLFQMHGPTDAPEVSVLARLEHEAAVCQAEWDPPATWLATTTAGAVVCLWRPDFSGEWLLCNTIAGAAEGMGAGAMVD